MQTKFKTAKQLVKGDILVRFGHKLSVENVSAAVVRGIAVVCVTHEQGTVHYTPNKEVEIA